MLIHLYRPEWLQCVVFCGLLQASQQRACTGHGCTAQNRLPIVLLQGPQQRPQKAALADLRRCSTFSTLFPLPCIGRFQFQETRRGLGPSGLQVVPAYPEIQSRFSRPVRARLAIASHMPQDLDTSRCLLCQPGRREGLQAHCPSRLPTRCAGCRRYCLRAGQPGFTASVGCIVQQRHRCGQAECLCRASRHTQATTVTQRIVKSQTLRSDGPCPCRAARHAGLALRHGTTCMHATSGFDT